MMRIPSQLGYILSGFAALAMLAACSGGSNATSAGLPQPGNGSSNQSIARRLQISAQSVVPVSMHKTVRLRHAAGRLVNPVSRLPLGPFDFVSDFGNNEVYVLNPSGGVEATFTSSTGLDFPQGMSVTNSPPRLYVANSGADNVLVYSSLNAPAVLSDAGAEPADVSADSSSGDIAVENYGGSVSCFTGGATTPTFTISGTSGTGTFFNIYFGAFDSAGNLYIDGFDNNGYAIAAEIVGGCSSPNNVVTDLTSTNNILFPGGLQVASNGYISIEDQQALVIYTYKPPVNGALGSPVATTPLTGSNDPVSFSFTAGSAQVLTADDGLTNANVYNFPAGGSPTKTFTLPGAVDPIGTAAYPSEQY